MARGDTQLIMSLTLVVTGCGLFLGGMGSTEWVVHRNATVTVSLWESCLAAGLCTVIKPGHSKAYFEACRALECLTLLVYIAAMASCFTADDRPPSHSWGVCVQRYAHVVTALAASGMTFLVVTIFAANYKDDDLFSDPSLGFSYWLTVIACICMTLGGVMRIVFITWPDRPVLPLPDNHPARRADVTPKAPRRRKAKLRADDQLGSDPLPQGQRPGDHAPPPNINEIVGEAFHKHSADQLPSLKVKLSRKQRFLAFFRTKKAKAVALAQEKLDIGVKKKPDPEVGGSPDADHSSPDPHTPSTIKQADAGEGSAAQLWGKLKPTSKPRTLQDDDPDSGEDTDTEGKAARRYGRRKNSEQATRRRKKKSRVAEPIFVGYNIPPTPGPDLPDIEACLQADTGPHSPDPGVRPYELVVSSQDLRARTVAQPPSVVYPPAQVRGEMDDYLDAKKFVQRVRTKSRTNSK